MDKKSNTKMVKIKENDLVNLIENIVNETVAKRKEKWLSEQESKNNKTLEETITKIVAQQLAK
jgi:hypothetical protein